MSSSFSLCGYRCAFGTHQTLPRKEGNFIPESNRLLHFLFSDARTAESLGVWKPVGDFALRELDRLAPKRANDRYNQATGEFEEREAWRSPICAAIRFFDIMVRAALHQGIRYHMWLYYLPPIVELMVRNYAPSGPLLVPSHEFQTPYNSLIYESVLTLRRWVKEAEEVPVHQPNVVLDSGRHQRESANIPKNSIIALAQCLRHVAVSADLSEKFKDSVIGCAFELYFTLRQSAKMGQYAEVLGAALCHGGSDCGPEDQVYVANLHDSFGRLRHEYEMTQEPNRVADLARALGIRPEGAPQ